TMPGPPQPAQSPVIFPHSSARSLCAHTRNVPDDILKLTAANGGVVMVCFMPGFVTERERADMKLRDQEKDRLEGLYPADAAKVEQALAAWRATHPAPHAATLADVANHIDHIRKVAGMD